MEQNDASSNLTEDVNVLSLKYQNEMLLEENKRLQEEINKLQLKIKQLQSGVTHVSDEELIANAQLERLKMKAMEQELTLEEIKKFDLLVKNKKLSEANTASLPAEYKNLPEDINDSELLQIASLSSSDAVPVKEITNAKEKK